MSLTHEISAAKVLEALKPAAKEAGCPLSFLLVPKGGDAAAACKEGIQFAKDSGGSVAGLAKLKQSGTLCDAFGGAMQSAGVELADAALCIGRLLVTHDRPSDLQNSKKAGFLTSSVMNVAVKKIEDSVDKRKVCPDTGTMDMTCRECCLFHKRVVSALVHESPCSRNCVRLGNAALNVI